MDLASIGIFDSGVGGLTVLKALREALPGESFIYLGDTARLPYGSKSPRTIRKYLAQNVEFLRARGVKAVVVACNTASTELDEAAWPGLAIYGVIRPGAEAAVMATHNGKIGVLATRTTVQSAAYQTALKLLNPKVDVIQQACPLLVPLVEEGWEDEAVTREVVARYLEAPLAHGADTLILGCTHYPVLKAVIQARAGSGIALIDSAQVMAHKIASDLNEGKIEPPTGRPGTDIWTTDLSEVFQQVGRRILAPFPANSWQLADI